jgi:hypothetical protein
VPQMAAFGLSVVGEPTSNPERLLIVALAAVRYESVWARHFLGAYSFTPSAANSLASSTAARAR